MRKSIKNRKVNDNILQRGDIYYADLSPVIGSEQGGIRPVLVVQNDVGNKYSPTVIAAAITVGLYRFPMSFCIIKTGRRPPCSEPTTGLRSA